MTRREAREAAFFAVFEKSINNNETSEIILAASDAENYSVDEFSLTLINCVFENLDTIDKKIEDNLTGWTLSRLPKTALAIMRISCAEMMYLEEIPSSISINEAVELAKTYCGEGDYQFVNGILGSIEKKLAAS